jgi:hypothetical protein
MASITIIGDVHGKTETYQKLIRRLPPDQPSIQVGDMGIGFKGVGLDKMPPHHGWFRGNHDDPAKCQKTTNYLGDWGYLPQYDIFYVAGAYSIDNAFRIEGVSWWSDEELSYAQFSEAIDEYARIKPRFVLSHEAPEKISAALLYDLMSPYFTAKAACQSSRTCSALQYMFELHQPKEWVFGHYHVNKQLESNGTLFTCVAELSTYELKLDN